MNTEQFVEELVQRTNDKFVENGITDIRLVYAPAIPLLFFAFKDAPVSTEIAACQLMARGLQLVPLMLEAFGEKMPDEEA